MTLEEVLQAVRAGTIRQHTLASMSGVSQPSISNLVTGKSATCSHHNALSLIRAAEQILLDQDGIKIKTRRPEVAAKAVAK